MLTTIHEFATDDQRARITWHGRTYRVVRIYLDHEGELSVFVVRTTKKGADYKNGDGLWLTLTYSLDKNGQGTELAAYIRELTAPAAKEDLPRA